MSPTLAVGDPRRRRVRALLYAALALMVLFEAFAQAPGVMPPLLRQSPWQNDPYHAVVSLTMFLVPAIGLLVIARTPLCRRREPVPVVRLRGLLRAAGYAAGLILLTGVVDLGAWLLRADHALWGRWTALLVAAAALLAVLSATILLLVRVLARDLPPDEGDEWVADLGPAADLLATATGARRLTDTAQRVAGALLDGRWGIRCHPVAWVLSAAELGALALAAPHVLEEGAPLSFIVPVSSVVAGSGFALAIVVANRSLRLCRVAPGHPHRRLVALGAAAGGLVGFAVRDQIWAPLTGTPVITSPGPMYLLMLAGAAVGAVAASTWVVVRQATWSDRFDNPIQ